MEKASMLIPRSEWGAAPPRKPIAYTDKDLFLIHHSGAKGTWPTVREETAAMWFWQQLHFDRWDAADLMYNAVIFPSGRAYEGRYGGWRANGGGAFSCNQRGFGACLAGDFTHEFPSVPALETLVKLGIEARQAIGVHPDRYWGHRQCYIYDDRNRGNECPGEMLFEWLPVLRKTVAAGAVEPKEEDDGMIVNMQEKPKQGTLFVWGAADVFTRIDNPRHSADYLCWLNIKNESPDPVPVQIFGTPKLAAGHPYEDVIPGFEKRGYDVYALNGNRHFNGSLILKSPSQNLIPSVTMLRLS